MAKAVTALTRDRENLAATLTAGDGILAGALDRWGAAKVEIARFRLMVERLMVRNERVRSEEFSHRVMRKVSEILPATGMMSASEILPLLANLRARQ